MKPSLLESIFGPNWRTTVSGLCTTGSGLLLVVLAFPPSVWQDYHVWIPLLLGTIAKTVKDCNTKDAAVTGNGTPNEPNKVAQSDGSNKVLAPTSVALLLLGAFFSFSVSGCANAPRPSSVSVGATFDPDTDQFGGNVTLDFPLPAPGGNAK